METIRISGVILRDTEGRYVIKEDCMLVECEDGNQYMIPRRNYANGEVFSFEDERNNRYIDIQFKEKENTEDIEITAEDTLPRNFSWDDKMTKLFLEFYKTYKKLFDVKKVETYERMWGLIAEEMEKHGYNVSAIEVENKFDSLEKAYRNVLYQNKKAGRRLLTCSFQRELADILGNKHSTFPLAAMGSDGLKVRIEAKEFMEDEAAASSGQSSFLPHSRRNRPGHLAQALNNVAAAIDRYTDFCRQKAVARQERHREKMIEIREIKALLKEYVELKKQTLMKRV